MSLLETDPVFVAIGQDDRTVPVTKADVSNLKIDGDRIKCNVQESAIQQVQRSLSGVKPESDGAIFAHIDKVSNPNSYNDLFDLAQVSPVTE